jgi:uncharacterized protein YbaA (DUF1428 family)
MGRYVDGFVLPVPKARLDDYLEMARQAGAVWKEYGALEYVECVADDVSEGEVTSFPRSVQLKPDETVIFAWIVYESREARDRINAQVMADERLNQMTPEDTPFDMQRMFFGGFSERVSY